MSLKRLKDGERISSYMKGGSKGQWFVINFEEHGLANFYINSSGLDTNLDLYVYEEYKTTSKLLGKSKEKPGNNQPDDIIRKVPVKANKDYYIYVKNRGNRSERYIIKAKNYPVKYPIEYDLKIYRPDPKEKEPFEIGENVTFEMEVKNYENRTSPECRIVAVDITDSKYKPQVAKTKYFTVPGDSRKIIDLEMDTWRPGERDIEFKIEVKDEYGFRNSKNHDMEIERTYKWSNDIPDDMGYQIMKKARAVLEDNKHILSEVFDESKKFRKTKVLFKELIKEIKKVSKGSKDALVVGLLAEAHGEYIVGGALGAGIYGDIHGNILVGPHFSGGVVYGKPGGGGAIKLVVFPYAEGVDTLRGLGITISANLSSYGASITNLDPKTICFSADLLTLETKDVFRIAKASVGIECGAIIDMNTIKELSRRDQSRFSQWLDELDLTAL